MPQQTTINITLGVIGLLVIVGYGWLRRRTLPERPVMLVGLVTAGVALVAAVLTAEVMAGRLDGLWRETVFESYGLLLDLILVGGLVLWLLERGRRKQAISGWLEEIGDLKRLATPEAVTRTMGLIRRLNRLGVSRIDLSLCQLPRTHLQDVNLSRARLVGAQLTAIQWPRAKLDQADLQSADLRHAQLADANLQGTILWGANLTRANLRAADLRGANLKAARLDGADLRAAQLSPASGLTVSQLATARSLHGARLDSSLDKTLQNSHPQLFVKPESASG